MQRTLLLVDDERSFRNMARKYLTGGGYAVIEAESAAQALELLDAHHAVIDAAVVDIVLPDDRFRKLAAQIHERKPSLPIIGMSGFHPSAFEAQLGELLALFLVKPFVWEHLLEKLDELIGPGHSGTGNGSP